MNGVYGLAFAIVLITMQQRTRAELDPSSTTTIRTTSPASRETLDNLMNCTIIWSQAWAQTIGLGVPTRNVLHAELMGNNDTYSIMCSLYSSHLKCLDGRVHVPSYHDVCTENHQEFDEPAACLMANASSIKNACFKENAAALAAAGQLAAEKRSRTLDELVKDYCSSLNEQIFCELSLVNGFCQFQSYDLLRRLIDAWLSSIRLVIGDEKLAKFFPTCETLLNTTRYGIPGIVDPFKTTTIGTTQVHSSTSSPHSTNTTSNTTTTASTSSMANSTAAIQRDAADPYKGDSGDQTSTPSSAEKLSIGGLTLMASVLFIFHSMIFSL